jgi:uncharacterized protein YaiL (DUF2058 family)
MSDLRDELRKAGLVSPKQVRQAKHQERVHRKDVGAEGLAAERAAGDEEFRRQQEEKRRKDREREGSLRQEQAERQREEGLRARIRGGWMREATSGARRFYFVVEGGRVTYLDLSDGAVRRLLGGGAAIAESRGAVRGEFCVIDGQTALALSREHPGVIRFWNRATER